MTTAEMRAIAQAESRALRLLHAAHGRAVRCAPTCWDDGPAVPFVDAMPPGTNVARLPERRWRAA